MFYKYFTIFITNFLRSTSIFETEFDKNSSRKIVYFKHRTFAQKETFHIVYIVQNNQPDDDQFPAQLPLSFLRPTTFAFACVPMKLQFFNARRLRNQSLKLREDFIRRSGLDGVFSRVVTNKFEFINAKQPLTPAISHCTLNQTLSKFAFAVLPSCVMRRIQGSAGVLNHPHVRVIELHSCNILADHHHIFLRE